MMTDYQEYNDDFDDWNEEDSFDSTWDLDDDFSNADFDWEDEE